MSRASGRRALSRASALDRRQREFNRAFAERRQDPFEAKPHRGRVTDKGKLDGSAGHRRSCALFPRVLSGRDQASATPTIAITPADGFECPRVYNAIAVIA